jgi:hypothetical protein
MVTQLTDDLPAQAVRQWLFISGRSHGRFHSRFAVLRSPPPPIRQHMLPCTENDEVLTCRS